MEVFPQKFHGTPCRVRCCSVLLEPYVLQVHFFKFWKEKLSDHFRIAFKINCNGTAVVFKEVKANCPYFRKITPNSDSFTMQRLLMKFLCLSCFSRLSCLQSNNACFAYSPTGSVEMGLSLKNRSTSGGRTSRSDSQAVWRALKSRSVSCCTTAILHG